MFAKDEDVEHDKFNAFYYYKVNVKYNKETFPSYLNVGKAKNDGKYHIYDITKPKKRNTADRINGLSRPVGNAIESSVSNNSITNSSENVKKNEKGSYMLDLNSKDNDYLKAVENGDIETAQKMVGRKQNI